MDRLNLKERRRYIMNYWATIVKGLHEIIKTQKEALSNEELMYEINSLSQLFSKYVEEQEKKGFCVQCCHPMYDGLCECGKHNDISVKLAEMLELRLLIYGYYNKDIKKLIDKKNNKNFSSYKIFRKMGEALDDTDTQKIIDILKYLMDEFSKEYKKRGFCCQCCDPYRKGICECGRYEEIDIINQVVIRLYNEHWLFQER